MAIFVLLEKVFLCRNGQVLILISYGLFFRFVSEHIPWIRVLDILSLSVAESVNIKNLVVEQLYSNSDGVGVFI